MFSYYKSEKKSYLSNAPNSLALAFSSLVTFARDLFDIRPPPQCFLISSKRSLKLVRTTSTKLANAVLSSELTFVSASAATDFKPATCPRRDRPPRTIQYGTPIFRHKLGRCKTTSTGSQSAAIHTNDAFFFSTNVVTAFEPYFFNVHKRLIFDINFN